MYSWLKDRRAIDIQEVVQVPHPVRNKVEFTFGWRYLFKDDSLNVPADTEDHPKVPAVGCMVTGWAGGVSRPHCCDNIPSEACAVVDVVDEFLASSPLPPYDTKSHLGFWRTLTIRTSRRTNECMLIFIHAPVIMEGGPKECRSEDFSGIFDQEKERLVGCLRKADLPVDGQGPMKVTSIYFQEFDGLSHPSPGHPVQHVYGKTHLLEKLGNCFFQISPGAFFQVNTEGAEILYRLVVDRVREVSENSSHTLLFDVCCGTGTIGLTCMKEGVVGQVVGVDISEPAIENAKMNAELNGLDVETKIRFVAARAEEVLSQEIGRAKQDPDITFVAVVDPAREGLHADVVKTLRANKRINRIVYVSCNPTGSLVRDAALLCSPPTKRYSGRAFKITSASPVDMFPMTSHCEMVMVFDRLGDDGHDDDDDGNNSNRLGDTQTCTHK